MRTPTSRPAERTFGAQIFRCAAMAPPPPPPLLPPPPRRRCPPRPRLPLLSASALRSGVAPRWRFSPLPSESSVLRFGMLVDSFPPKKKGKLQSAIIALTSEIYASIYFRLRRNDSIHPTPGRKGKAKTGMAKRGGRRRRLRWREAGAGDGVGGEAGCTGWLRMLAAPARACGPVVLVTHPRSRARRDDVGAPSGWVSAAPDVGPTQHGPRYWRARDVAVRCLPPGPVLGGGSPARLLHDAGFPSLSRE